ncbi:hypothetical protein V2E24_00175 [Mycoplasmopsis ciconiae]|uniref:Spermidine/putrescine ABC transporter substrate-binding protein n=1 Tax=Mycoplasmopsis ciconiae TaxID=561067 RepID=A0ABU7MKL7_9BACT|nr:hypothetical protein [Mycoplasmopsis ciconiae]
MKHSKKIWLSLISFISVVAILGGSLIYKSTHGYKPNFYNYKSYISKHNREVVSQKLQYTVFNEINEFNTALINNKTVGGIGSDFQVAALVKQGYLAKINYSKLFDMPELEEKDYETALKTVMSPAIWEHINSYDAYLNENNTSKPIHLWEYFYPYYSQDATITYNTKKARNNDSFAQITEQDLENNLATINNPLGIKDAYSMFNILNTLSKNGYTHLYLTDALRDNLLYGSAYKVVTPEQGNTIIRSDKEFSGKVLRENYKSLINDFRDLIKDSFNQSINDSQHITFKGDGLEMLTTVLDPKQPLAQMAIMYNGDALDSYYSSDNFTDVEEGTVDVIKPSKNILLVDGLVINKNIKEENQDRIYSSLNSAFYKNHSLVYKQMIKNKINKQQAFLKVASEIYQDFINDFISAKIQELDEQIAKTQDQDSLEKLKQRREILNKSNIEKLVTNLTKNYQVDYSYQNPFALKLFQENNDLLAYAQAILGEDDVELLARIFSIIHFDRLEKDQTNYLKEKYSNLNNFDLINYTPTNDLEYILFRNNYFVDYETGEIDEKARYIYTIDFEKDKNNPNFAHAAIEPIDRQLLSDVNTYYYEVTKN